MALTAWDEQQFYQNRRDAIATAGARMGRSLHRVMSKGAGQVHLVEPLTFQLTFAEQPTFTSGVAIGTGQLADGSYPIVTTGVANWQVDARGFYTGAWLWFGVTMAPTHVTAGPTDTVSGTEQAILVSNRTAIEQAIAMANVQLEHHLCFEGLALRDVNYDAIMADG